MTLPNVGSLSFELSAFELSHRYSRKPLGSNERVQVASGRCSYGATQVFLRLSAAPMVVLTVAGVARVVREQMVCGCASPWASAVARVLPLVAAIGRVDLVDLTVARRAWLSRPVRWASSPAC